ncbi:MAG: family 16 glycoside hydrolase [Bacteroidia bacterium]
MRKNYLLLLSLIGFFGSLWGQPSSDLYQSADFSTLSFFKPNAGNWQIAGNATADLNKNEALNTEPGQGILVNLPNDKQKSNLFTVMEHGDIDLDVEFMMAKHSNSGIYLMGRYEIQLLDSWGNKNPRYGDVGGIYARRDENGRDYQGNAPRSNASKAPGLWQNMHIEFQAPRFDALGHKIQNAKVIKVILNGTVVQENVELTGPTGGPAFAEEGPKGPIMIQGDHGPVAFRHLRYKLYEPSDLKAEKLTYSLYTGQFNQLPDLTKEKPISSGSMESLTQEVVTENEKFIYVVKGELDLPASGAYAFDLSVRGNGVLKVGGKTVLDYGWGDRKGTVELEAGKQPFEIIYHKPDGWYPNGLGLFISGPGIRTKALHTLSSLPLSNPENPIYISVENETRITRCFMDYRSEGKNRRIVHAISVGFPEGTSFTYDPDRANLVQVWKGDYLNATPMWNDRGNGSSRPNGTLVPLQDRAGMNVLTNPDAAWPEEIAELSQYHFKGYTVDENNNPTFHYLFGQTTFTDKVSAEDGGKSLLREIKASGSDTQLPTFLLLGSGEKIKDLGNQLYSVDDHFYIRLNSKTPKAEIRTSGVEQQLILPIQVKGKEVAISYSIIW